jgi:putative membrane protein
VVGNRRVPLDQYRIVALAGRNGEGHGVYLQNHVFWTKMGLLVLMVILEVSPILTLGRWRRQLAAGAAPDLMPAPRLARISFVQAGLIVLMVLAATAMARGYGVGGP